LFLEVISLAFPKGEDLDVVVPGNGRVRSTGLQADAISALTLHLSPKCDLLSIWLDLEKLVYVKPDLGLRMFDAVVYGAAGAAGPRGQEL
jgi:hypothetical protein